MTKNAALLAVLAVSLAACSVKNDDAPKTTAEPEIKARCNELPQWTTKDEKGQDIAIYVCFGEKAQLLYTMRVIPKVDPVAQQLAAAKAEAEALRAELQKAKGASAPPASAITKPAAKAAALPTVSGTAASTAKR